MTVYIDKANIPYRRMKMCHMIADSLDELHLMADAIGVKRKWFQSHTKYPHYDICLSSKAKAMKLGAVECSSKELVLKARELKKQHKYDNS